MGATLTQLAQEYVQNNASLRDSRQRIYSAGQDTALLKATKTWALGYTPVHRRDTLQTLSPFAPTKSTTFEHAFSLTKDFTWGGSLSLTKRLTHLEQDRNPMFFREEPKLDTHRFTHEIRYRQNLGADFFGRTFRQERFTSEQRHKLAQREYQKILQGGLLGLSQSYTQVRLQRSLVHLQREAHKRAKAFNAFVRKRVKDGLREKVDLYRSESNIYLQKEQVNSALQNLVSSLERLSVSLHRQLKAREIKPFDEQEKRTLPKGDPIVSNADLATITHQQQILELQLDKVGYEFLPRIGLNLGYQTNAVDPNQTETWKQGNLLNGEHNAVDIALTLNWPLGNAPQRALRSKLRSEKSTLNMRKERLTQNILLRSQQIKEQITHLENNIRTSKKREALAYKVVKELNRLYRKGRSDFDQVLRGEEELIRTQSAFVRHLAQRDILFYSLLHLHGILDKHLLVQGVQSSNL